MDGKAYVVRIIRLTEISASKLPPYLSMLIGRRKRGTFAALHHPNKDRSEAILPFRQCCWEVFVYLCQGVPDDNLKNLNYGEETI